MTTPEKRGPIRRFLLRHPAVVDVAVAIIYVALFVPMLTDLGRVSANARWAVPAYLTVIVAGILLRRHLPLTFFAGTILLPVALHCVTGGFGSPPQVTGLPQEAILGSVISGERIHMPYYISFVDLPALSIAAYNLGALKQLRLAAPIALAGLGIVLATTAYFSPRSDLIIWATTICLTMAVSFLTGSNVRASRLRMAQLEQRARQLALEHEQREQLAVSQERTRIAREMHDVVAHSLSVMVTLAEGAAVALDRNPARAKDAVTQLAAVGRESLQDARRLVGVLRQDAPSSPAPEGQPAGMAEEDTPLEPQPGQQDVRTLVHAYRAAGMPVTYVESGPELPDDAGFQLAIYRIVQEALTNVLRYARTSPHIEVTVNRTGRDVVVAIENEAGDGQKILPGSGKGVIGMRERAAVYDGTVHAGPTTRGWQVRATLRVPGQSRSWSSPG